MLNSSKITFLFMRARWTDDEHIIIFFTENKESFFFSLSGDHMGGRGITSPTTY
jgi:hypothetical protein